MMYDLKTLKHKKQIISFIDDAKYKVHFTTKSQFDKRSFSNLRTEWNLPNLIKGIY